MGTGYVRNDVGNNIADGNVINASDLDGEFDAVQAAFNGSTGHSHDGTTGEGPQIDTAGLADSAVETAKINTGAVTEDKLATDAVTNAKIATGAVDTAEIANDAVTGAKIDSTTTITAAGFSGPLTGNVTGDVTGDVSGNAGTATALQTARTIGGVSFDGTANINLPGVNQSGTQDTSGNAATATALATGRTISLTGDVTGTSASFDGTGNVSITATVADDSHNHVISNVDGLQTALDNKQPLDSQLTDVAGLTPTDGNFIVGNGTNFVAESGSTARTSLGLGSLATLSEVNASTIADNSVGAAELNVSGNGTSGQALTSDGDGTMSWTTISADPYDTASSSTGYFDLPAGTTAQRPASPANGMIRYNTTTNEAEVYAQGEWIGFYENPNAYTIEYLLVAGGGSGGSGQGGSWGSGGGGAGGAVDSSGTVISGLSYTVTVGAGAAQQTSNPGQGGTGSTSSITGIGAVTSLGGGGGGADFGPFSTAGDDGGSGAGGAGGGNASGGSGTTGQGNNGGQGANGGGGGGGGGAGAVGGSSSSGTGGTGGNGINWKSLGTTYAGGGGGGSTSGTAPSGGSGGGGSGGSSGNGGSAGSANTGGGGGGGGSGSVDGGAGGSGKVIIRYQSASQLGSGGTVTSSGGYYYHTFNSSGTFTA